MGAYGGFLRELYEYLMAFKGLDAHLMGLVWSVLYWFLVGCLKVIRLLSRSIYAIILSI